MWLELSILFCFCQNNTQYTEVNLSTAVKHQSSSHVCVRECEKGPYVHRVFGLSSGDVADGTTG